MDRDLGGGLSDDAFLGGRLRILQPRSGAYRAGLDAVLVAAAVPVDPSRSSSVLDVGAGVGVLGLCVAARAASARVTLVEVDPTLAAIAQRNIERNGLASRASVHHADISDGGAGLARLLPENGYDHVVANPPYHDRARTTSSPHDRKARANAMRQSDLAAWFAFLAASCKARGSLTVIHRADALPALLAHMTPRFGSLSVQPIHPREGLPATRVILTGIKGSRGALRILPGLCLHGPTGHAFSPAIDAVLRHGAPLPHRA